MPEINKEIERNQLSDFLPYLAYDAVTGEFLNKDDTYGYIYECCPLYFAGNDTLKMLTSVLKQEYGVGTILQFILYADTNISNYCASVKNSTQRENNIAQKMNDHYSKFIKNINNYGTKTKNNRLKNYRLFVCLKTYEKLEVNSLNSFEEALTGLSFRPAKMDAKALISLARGFLNNEEHQTPSTYDETKEISKQIIFADTHIDFSDPDHLKIGNEFVSCITPKEFPDGDDTDKKAKQGLDILSINQLIGNYSGGMSDLSQIPSRFIWSCNVLLEVPSKELLVKSSMANAQRAGARLSNDISKRMGALTLAQKNAQSEKYCKFIPSIVIFAKSLKELATSETRVRTIWEAQNFKIQKEKYIKHIVFLLSLPFGLYPGKNNSNIALIDRHFIASAEGIAAQLPVQADYNGFGAPIVPFVGRKLQVQGLDLFSPHANNHNFICCATSGSGKSFTLNWILSHYFACNAKIRLVDVGGSYKKICHLLGGAYLDINEKNTDINFNPFQTIPNLKKDYIDCSTEEYDEEDKSHDIGSIVKIIGSMLYSSNNGQLSPEEYNLISHAVKYVIASGRTENGIDALQDYLHNVRNYASESQIPTSLIERAKELAFTLCEFSSEGSFGRYFNGVGKNSWQQNDFVVLELESLMKYEPLLKVVMLQVINLMTTEMYQGDRSIKKMLVLEELSTLLKVSKSDFINDIAIDAYRRARKYNGSVGSVFQSITDIKKFGEVGAVMFENSAWKLFLESDGLEGAIKDKIIHYEGLAKELLLSIKSNRPHYSEIFLDSPGGVGILRLMVDPFGYAVATTNPEEVVEIENYQKDGLSILDAVEKFAAKRGLVT